ncbi:MAG: homoserine kinase [Gammaproteobacteria bacterium]|nr:homoserine kinase [Gammaproteobacteria bacterium]
MSVYTALSENEFSEILKLYDLGDFIHAEGIQAGIENTNYFLKTSKGDYVFTVFEKINKQELEFYIPLLQKLSAAGIACPQPISNKQHQIFNFIKNKPYLIVTRLQGSNILHASPEHCSIIATALAQLHTSPLTFSQKMINRRGQHWREKTASSLSAQLSANDAKLLQQEISFYQLFDDSELPKGIIHADLFKDNAIFDNGRLSGIIDFYDACYDSYLYDIAITVNDWCTNENGEIIKENIDAFLHGYQSIRKLTQAEKIAWPIMLRIAAMRFWLSRLEDAFLQREGDLTQRKNPVTYLQILQHHIQKPQSIENLPYKTRAKICG